MPSDTARTVPEGYDGPWTSIQVTHDELRYLLDLVHKEYTCNFGVGRPETKGCLWAYLRARVHALP